MFKDTDIAHQIQYSGNIKEHRQQIQVTETPYAIRSYDQSIFVTGGATVLNLPLLADADGRQYFIHGGTGNVTVTAQPTELIDGVATLTVGAGASAIIEASPLGWMIVSVRA